MFASGDHVIADGRKQCYDVPLVAAILVVVNTAIPHHNKVFGPRKGKKSLSNER